MVKKFKVQRNSMAFVIGVALLLLLGAYILPMRTSIGQGINERLVTSWQAVMAPDTHEEYYRANFSDGSFLQFQISGISQSLFKEKTSDGYLATPVDLPLVIQAAYGEHKNKLERTLGTYQNAPSLFHPFSEIPIAYSANFLEELTRKSINLKTYGGPNIPPGTVHTSQLPAGVLHIDTKADDNTLAQCAPGQVPFSLKGMVT